MLSTEYLMILRLVWTNFGDNNKRYFGIVWQHQPLYMNYLIELRTSASLMLRVFQKKYQIALTICKYSGESENVLNFLIMRSLKC